VGILGTIATIVGLVVALRQLRRTATAAEASRTASREAERRTTAAIALSLVDHLLIVDNELDSALVGSRDEVLRVIRHWRQTAGEVQRLAVTLDPLERDFARRLQESIALATACAHGLDAALPLPPQVAEFRRVVGALCNDVPELKAHLATRSGGELA
jgi:membrane protein required for beta-lactamase induction